QVEVLTPQLAVVRDEEVTGDPRAEAGLGEADEALRLRRAPGRLLARRHVAGQTLLHDRQRQAVKVGLERVGQVHAVAVNAGAPDDTAELARREQPLDEGLD